MAQQQQPVRSPTGTISVRTTDRGLPIELRLDPVELQKSPQQLAHDIMALCQLAATRAQVARRRGLVERGFTASAIRGLHLATEEDLSRAEEEAFGDDDELLPTTLQSE
jgi:hypothetical protein